ncbi:MAG TPA: transaldolase family protein [Candidatus Limnocylindria bacterium]|nr:transaldolase family protein [Candidatus Limnocylindria bacterium]
MTVATHEPPPRPADGPEPALLRMVRETSTDYWNDSCALAELEYAIARGASGATSNPTIVLEVLRKETSTWGPRLVDLAAANPAWTEEDLTWALIEEMGVGAARLLEPVFRATDGRSGRLSLQTNPVNYRNADRMLEQGLRFASLGPNFQVKFPATAAGIEAVERATLAGVSINATVSFTVAQAVAVAEAVERASAQRERDGLDTTSIAPVCTLMVGRLEDHLRSVADRDGIAVDPDALHWSGIAAFKRALAIYRERGYRTRLLAAAMRHRLHWTELVGGDVIITMPHAWQVRFNASGIAPTPRIDEPVEARFVDDLLARIPDFRLAYEPEALAVEAFDTYGATVRTLRTFIASYHELVGVVRDVMLPNPDLPAKVTRP